MGLKKGMTNNPKGRPKGAANKVSTSMRERINTFLDENFDLVQEDFKKLDPKDKLLFYTKLLAFGLPTLKAVDHTGITNNSMDDLTDEQLNEIIKEITNRLD